MAPPRSTDTEPGATVDAYDALVADIHDLQGVVNAADGRVVVLAGRAIELGVSGGTHLTPQKWLEWQAGMSPGRAADAIRLAKRSAELPHTIAALEAGELSLDQAAVVARYVPARYDASAARVASCCTVRQLRQVLPWFSDKTKDKPAPVDPYVSTGFDEQGWWIRGRLPEAEGIVVDQALKTMREDLERQARADAPDGAEPVRVTAADALVAQAEAALHTGETTRPGTDRYLVHVHLQAGPDGTVELFTHLGIPLPDGQRRHLLCDAKFRALVHDGTAPLGTGRTTRGISRRMRRAVEHRDHGRCTVPGCGATHNLEIHHIWHWEDGGPTETWNLTTLCSFHHHLHHQDRLGITGNADHPPHTAPGLIYTDQWGRPLDPTGQPVPPTPGTKPTDAAVRIGITPGTYLGPTGEPLDRWGFHLQPDTPEPADTGPHAAPNDPDDPPPQITGHRPRPTDTDPTGPDTHTAIDATRAGPAHA